MSDPSDLDKLRQMTGAPDVNEPLVSEDAFADIEVHSERPTWKLPLPKLLLIGTVLVPVFGLAGYFLLAGGRQSESSVASTPTTEPDTSSLPPETDPALQQARSEIAGLKARMALADQAYVQQQSRAAQTPKPSGNTTQANPKPSAPEAPTRLVSSTARSSSPASTVRYQPPAPQIRTAAASAPSPSSPNPQFSQVDPTERWQQLARLGSYGAMAEAPLPTDEGVVAERSPRTVTVVTVPTARTAPTSAVAALPKSSSSHQTSGPETAIPAQTSTPEVIAEEAVFTDDANNADSENETDLLSGTERGNDADLSSETESAPELTDTAEIAQTPVEASDSAFLEDAEALILQEPSQPQSLIAGAYSSGHLATPVILDNPESADRYLVVLTEPLTDNRGQVAIPAGSEVVIQVDSVAENRLVQLSATEVVWDEQGYQREVILPERVIQVRGEGGNPLVAQQFEDRGGDIAAMDVGQFALGAVRRTAELYTRSSSRVQTGDGTTVITEENPAPNILAGALEGGTDAILDTITERNQQAIEDMRNRPNIRYLAAGTPVQVFVNESMQMPL